MQYDFHTHILPRMDDGAANSGTAVKLLCRLRDQGVGVVCATPHYYAHREPPEAFLQRRAAAWMRLQEAWGARADRPDVVLGAEVALERGVHRRDLRGLTLGESRTLLIELPFAPYGEWMLEEVYHLTLQGIRPLFAHLDRYIGRFSDAQLREIRTFEGACVQINHEALYHWRTRRAVKAWMGEGVPVVWGSDCHNLTRRAPTHPRADKLLRRCATATQQERSNAVAAALLAPDAPA